LEVCHLRTSLEAELLPTCGEPGGKGEDTFKVDYGDKHREVEGDIERRPRRVEKKGQNRR
jgi:hypothetical protein